MNKKISKLLIFFTTATLVVGKAYADTQVEQGIITSVQPTVAISKLSSSTETGTVNPENGTHGGLSSIFSLQTNGTDEDYDFIVTSSITAEGGEVSAYGQSGSILFGNTSILPTASAINDAKIGGNDNDNVIAYPVSVTITSPMTVEYSASNSVYGDCYVVKVNEGGEGTLTHTVGTSPVSGTYNMTRDSAGSYKSTVTFTAVSK
jgi:hypothetical protein